MPVSTMTGGQYGIAAIYLSLPVVVRRDGVEKIVMLPLDEAEGEGLLASADLLKRKIRN